jgi:hypothetical protein
MSIGYVRGGYSGLEGPRPFTNEQRAFTKGIFSSLSWQPPLRVEGDPLVEARLLSGESTQIIHRARQLDGNAP